MDCTKLRFRAADHTQESACPRDAPAARELRTNSPKTRISVLLVDGDLAPAFVSTTSLRMRGDSLRFQAQYLRRIRVPAWKTVRPRYLTLLNRSNFELSDFCCVIIGFHYIDFMKVTVELPEEEMREICELSGIAKKGPAIRLLLADALQLRRRARISRKFLDGEWSAELDGYEAAREADRRTARTLAEQWRD